MDTPACQHCGHFRAWQPWQLCHKCYKDRAIRALYRPGGLVTREARPSFQDTYRAPPDTPVQAWPGSEAKIRAMEERLTAKRQLFHPMDRSDFGDDEESG